MDNQIFISETLDLIRRGKTEEAETAIRNLRDRDISQFNHMREEFELWLEEYSDEAFDVLSSNIESI